MPRIFLTAEWRNLIIVSYHAPAELLAPHLPHGLEPELIDGAPTVSLVAFEFRNTRVFGVPWPGFVNFPEWNLRFYVQSREPTPRRGVVFIREFVQSRLIAGIARSLYNEPYAVAPFEHATRIADGNAASRYSIRVGGSEHTMEATASDRLTTPAPGSVENLLKEQTWGFGKRRDGRTLCYEVRHPEWRVYEATHTRVEVDWALLYGAEWGVMQTVRPFSSMLVEGSRVTVAAAEVL